MHVYVGIYNILYLSAFICTFHLSIKFFGMEMQTLQSFLASLLSLYYHC